ncbi:MAG TPA: right-handed parallel beta-helix repeat-containing protein [Polyangiaceae bacterium]|nr:right-handed parallel beta-helix repeat-containing protein [Polyangiaceae bacterium]
MRSPCVLSNVGLCLLALGCSDGGEAIGRHSEALGITFVVDDSGDAGDADTADRLCATAAGVCTLRAAFEQLAAAPTGGGEPDAIHFAIPGDGVHTIVVGAPLVAHSDTASVPVIVDGYTQPGSEPATASDPARILIEIVGAAGVESGIVIHGNSTVRGLTLNHFFEEAGGEPDQGSVVVYGDDNVVEGCHLGLDAAGTRTFGDRTWGAGVRIYGDRNRIGGATPAQRNVIAGTGFFGVMVHGSNWPDVRTPRDNVISGNFVGLDASGAARPQNDAENRFLGGIYVWRAERTEVSNNVASDSDVGINFEHSSGGAVFGNFIGTDVTGTFAFGNHGQDLRLTSGLHLGLSYDVTVGGPGDMRNVISANWVGIDIESGDGHRIEGNLIGTDASGTQPLGNRDHGIEINDFADDFGPTVVVDNVIAYNRGEGIHILAGDRVRVVSNEFFGNGGFGINLNSPFANETPNDPGDVDEGWPNQLQNFPVLESFEYAGSTMTVSGTLDSGLDRDYLIQIFANDSCDPSGYGEAQELVGETLLHTGTGPTTFSVVLPAQRSGTQLTATATDDAENRTSELSACLPLNRPPVAVCEAQTVSAGPACTADANIDGGSFDPDGDALTFRQDPPGPYSLGENPVVLGVRDPFGGLDTCTTTVTVVDHTPPVAVCPANIEADAVSAAGAPVTYSASATDNCRGVVLSCLPPSGGVFAIGSVDVTCTASDGASLTSSCTFSVHVRGAQEQLGGLRDTIVGLGLPGGTENSLLATIDAALGRIAAGKGNAACGQLGALRNEIMAQRGGAITATDADALVAAIDRVRTVLGC